MAGVALRRGSKLGKYRLDRRIGKGAYAAVWRARDTVEKRYVALKVAFPELVREYGRGALEHEARIASRLSHPNIVAIRNADWIDGYFVIASDLAERNLTDYPGARRSARVGLKVIRDVAAGLAHAHAQKVLHRDVKPENILILPDRRAALCDFGVSRFAKGASETYTEAGTLGYMAPEQAYGRPKFTSDVFSLGLIAYQLAGRCPSHLALHLAASGVRPLQGAGAGAPVAGPEEGGLLRSPAPLRRRGGLSPGPRVRISASRGAPGAAPAHLARSARRPGPLRWRSRPSSSGAATAPSWGCATAASAATVRSPSRCSTARGAARPTTPSGTSAPIRWSVPSASGGFARSGPPVPGATRVASPATDARSAPTPRPSATAAAAAARDGCSPSCATARCASRSRGGSGRTPSSSDRCPRCRWPVSREFWRFCAWCGRREPAAGWVRRRA